MRSLVLVVVLALGAAACRTPPAVAPLAHVEEAKALRVRFVPREIDEAHAEEMNDELREALEGFDRALFDALTRAGYAVAKTGPYDVRIRRELTLRHESMRGRGHVNQRDITRAVLRVVDGKKNELDRFEFRASSGLAPADEPERVAIELVNAMIASPKVGRFAEERRAKRQKRSAPLDDAPADAPPPPAEDAPTKSL